MSDTRPSLRLFNVVPQLEMPKSSMMVVTIKEATRFGCLGGPAECNVEIEYIPDGELIELISFHNWITTAFKNHVNTVGEDICAFIYKAIQEEVHPRSLSVELSSAVQTAHGPMTVTICSE